MPQDNDSDIDNYKKPLIIIAISQVTGTSVICTIKVSKKIEKLPGPTVFHVPLWQKPLKTVAHSQHKADKTEASYSAWSGGFSRSTTVTNPGANFASKGHHDDHFSDMSFVDLHESLSSTKIIQAKQALEHVQFKHCIGKNGQFTNNAFVCAAELLQQTISFCGVGTNHQNGIAE